MPHTRGENGAGRGRDGPVLGPKNGADPGRPIPNYLSNKKIK